MTSDADANLCGGPTGSWAPLWAGSSEIQLLQNGNLIHSFQPRFTDDEICLTGDQVDRVNDVFELRSTNNDGVITE